MRPTLLVILFTYTVSMFSQEICTDNTETIVDVYDLSAKKCAADEKEKKPIKRYLKKRKRKTTHKNNNTTKTNILALTKVVDKVVAFEKVDVTPMFLDCNNNDSNCFNEQMNNHIGEHFNYPKKAIRNDIEGEVWVKFVINKSGEIEDLNVTSTEDSNLLTGEAKRIVSLLPKFKPGKHKGKNTKVAYKFLMTFSL